MLTYRLPPVLRAFRALYPRVHPILHPVACHDLPQRLGEGMLVVAFVIDTANRLSMLEAVELLAEELVVAVPPTHRLARHERVVESDLAGERLLLTGKGCSYRALLETALVGAGVHPGAIFDFSSAEAIQQGVIAGAGLAFLPRVVVAAEAAAGTLAVLPWGGLPIRVQLQTLRHKDQSVSPTLRAFLAVTSRVLGLQGDVFASM